MYKYLLSGTMSISNQNFAQRGVIIVKKFLAVMLAVLVLTSCAAFAEDEEVKVGILAFQSSTVDVGQGQAEIIGDVFTQRMEMCDVIEVFGRGDMTTAASEAKVSMTGHISNKNAAKIGAAAGCKYVIAGTVTNLKMKASTSGVAIIGAFGSHKEEATAAADMRIIDVETGDVVESIAESTKASQSGSYAGIAGGYSGETDLNGMQQAAIADLATRLCLKFREFIGDPVTVKSAGAKSITLGIGTMGGANKDTFFRVFTGDSKRGQTLAVVKVSEAGSEQATAVIAGKNCGNLSLVQKGDKIALIDSDELKALQKGKKFAKSRPREKGTSEEDIDELLSGTKKKSKRTK